MAVAFTLRASAQTVAVAQLSGTVIDGTGGALPGVVVTVTQTDTGVTRTAVTGTDGGFVFTNLPVGPYKLVSKLQGFSPFEQTGITLAVGNTRSVNVTMKIGAMTDTIKVVADATLVETRSIGMGTVVPQAQIVGLPLNGRSALQLIVLAGSAVEVTGLTDDRQYPGAVSIAVAGGTGNSTMYLVDGGYNNDPQNNTGNAIPFPDALQEFNVQTGVRDARFGMSTGATVNAVTKSGTNNFHGGMFDFARNHNFNAIRYFERKENGGLGRDDGLQRNQFGGTIGGPIKKDKLFFFFGTQVTKNHIVPLNNDVTVPTAEVLAGDFRRIMSAACRGGTARTLGAPFVNNMIDPALYHPISKKILSMVPVADPAYDSNGCGRYLLALPNDSTDQQYVSRVDYQMTGNKRVYVRDFFTHNIHPAAWDASRPNLLETTGVGRGTRAYQHTISSGLDYVVSQNLFASTRFSYQHTATFREHGANVPTWASLGVNTWTYTVGTVKGQDFLRGGLWSSAFTGVFYVDTPSLSQDFDWSRGNHSISFGGNWTRPHPDGDGTFQSNGNMGFSGIYTSGTSNANGGLNMADFVLGLPNSYRGGGSQINNAWEHSIGLYAADVWRINRKLTLNYGLRWEPYISAKDANGFNTAFIRENFDKGIRSSVYTNAPVGLVFPGDPGFPTDGGNTLNKWAQFAPRFGLVWDPKGDNQQTIRAGAGIYYDAPKLWETAHHMLNPPFGNTVDALVPGNPALCPGKPSKNGCPLDFVNPWSATPGGDPQAYFGHQGDPVVLAPRNVSFPLNGVYVSMPIDANPMRQYQWNLAYQRQLPLGMLAEVAYTGNKTEHTWVAGYNENPSIYIPGDCVAGQYGLTVPGPCSNTTTANRQARALLSLLNPTEGKYYAVNGVEQAYLDATGHYHGVKFSMQKRLRNNWSANANYTLSKCINQGEPGTDIGTTFPVSLIDPINNPHPDPLSNEGPCVSDRRHNFNLSAVAITPGIGPGWLKTVLKDWQIGFIYQARSGSPITPTTTGDFALTNGPQRPIIVSGVNPYVAAADRTWAVLGSAPSRAWFNLAAFAPNTPGVWGNTPKGYLVGPSYWNADLSFSRNLNMAHGRRVEIRVEAFNLFDNQNWSNPTVQIGSTSLTNGRVTNTTGDPRIMQFALKFSF
ncbi:MAG TPA: TonB-dependent receptor [Vicinamibacterales bacterium]|nr:TonB-dependent receptor [Vicinamibacterales bacterium]